LDTTSTCLNKYQINTDSGTCVTTCSVGYYKNGTLCIPCRSECATCDNINACTSCRNGF
jgi:hypothetical protein